METQEVKMYSDYKSPFAFLAFDPAYELEARYRVRIRWIPYQLRIKGPGQRSVYSDYKAKYSYLDARRWAGPRGIVIRGPKKIYDTTPALIGGLFADARGRLIDYSRKAFELFFRRELELDEPEAIAGLLTALGLSSDQYRAYLAGQGARDLESAAREAEADRIFGVPIFIFAGEPFWGHDRLSVLEARLKEAGLAIAR